MADKNQMETPKRKRGRPPKKSYEQSNRPNEVLFAKEKTKDETLYATRTKASKKSDIEALILQSISKNTTNRSFSSYTKALVRQYLLNPFNYRTQLRALSQYLFRANTIYRKIILYYACMPLYNYTVTEEIDLSKKYNASKSMKKYTNVIKRLSHINMRNDYAQMIAFALINGAYFGYIYDQEDKGLFYHYLDPDYCKIVGKNEAGCWLVAFDFSYFSKGDNKQFVEGIDGDMSGCWDDAWIELYKEYKKDTTNNRWLVLPQEKTICITSGLDDEFDMVLPFFTGIFPLLMTCDEYSDALADKAVLENYKLLLSKIPMIKNSNLVDDFALSLEIATEMQDMINEQLPEQVGGVVSPMDMEVVSFENSNKTNDVDMLSTSVANVFNNAGASQLVVTGMATTSATALRAQMANDASNTFLWLSRIQHYMNYYIGINWEQNFKMQFHEQTWFNKDEYISSMKDAASLGADPMLYLTALGRTPYAIWCGQHMSNAMGIRDIMIPLQSSYNTSSDNIGGGQTKPDWQVGDEGEASRTKRDVAH